MLGHEVAAHYQRLADEAGALLEQYGELHNSLKLDRSRVADRLGEARLELAAIYLPRLDHHALLAAETKTGFRGFSRRDPLDAKEKEKHRLEHDIQRIQGTDRYRRREYLVGKEGELTRELAEARSMLEPWERDAASFEDHEGFLDLVDLGYDTPDFAERWWQSSYWKHWARGDAICEALQMDDFGDDVLPAYRKVVKGRTRWRKEVARIEKKVRGVHGIVQAHDQAVARLQDLDGIYLRECHKVLAEHLELADPALLAQWSEGDRGVAMALGKIAGLQAKRDFLADAIQRGLEATMTSLAERRHKYERKVAKYLRNKRFYARIPEREIDRKFDAKIGKLRQRREKLATSSTRVLAFEDYGRFDLADEPELWWWLFSDGKRPPRLTPELRDWYDRHPEATPGQDALETQTLTDQAVAAAGAREFDDLGDLS